MVVSARALSSASPTVPIDGIRPSRNRVCPKWTAVYWLPAPLWCTVACGGCPSRRRRAGGLAYRSLDEAGVLGQRAFSIRAAVDTPTDRTPGTAQAVNPCA
jgi:hypothetical protein